MLKNYNPTNNIKLTVSLISSGRSESIERCLASVASLKPCFSTEIIVVDTDPKHQHDVRKIVEKYADLIIPFSWCDDFAAARNVGLSQAKGEWFLYIDDDEWLLDQRPLIAFFQGQKSEKFDQAGFYIRNYHNHKLNTYDDSRIVRLYRRIDGMRFFGRVHEYLSPIGSRTTTIQAVLGHTGYIYQSIEEKQIHARRNIPLLMAMLEEEPENPRWYYHLILEYDNLDEREKVRSICEKAISLLESNPSQEAADFRGLFIAERLRMERLDENIPEAERLYRKYRNETQKIGPAADAYLDMEGSRIYYMLEQDDKCLKLCRSYQKKLQKYSGKTATLSDISLFFLSATFKPQISSVVEDLLQKVEAIRKDKERVNGGDVQEEMLKLAQTLRQKAVQLEAMGMTDDAMKILKQIKAILNRE